MAENLNLNVNVNTSGAEGSIGSLKKQLREAQNEVVSLSDKFGATSVQAVNAAKKAAELRDRIGDAKALTDAFNPDAKFKALTASLSGVAGGFGAVQGAMALFGNESENVQKTLLKVQSAMAISQGLQAIGESVDSFKNLGTVIKTQVISAFTTLRGAIIATGIGALAVGLGLLVANFDKVKETIIKIFPSLEGFGDKVKGIINGITDFIGVTSQAERDAEQLSKAIDKITDSYDIAIQELEAQGGREQEVYDLKKKRIEAQLSALTDANDKEYKQRAKLHSDLKVLDFQEENRKREIQIENLEYAIKTEIDAENQKYERLKQVRDKIGKQEIIDWKEIKENQKKDKEDTEKENEDRANKVVEDGLGRRTATTFNWMQTYTDNQKKNQSDLLDAQKQFENAKLDIVFNGLALVSQLAGQNTAVGKAAAIADIAIGTGVGFINALDIAQKSAKATGPAAAFAFPIFYATQIAAVLGAASRAKSILSTSSTSSISAPSMSSQAPVMPQVPQAQMTQLNQQSINDISNQAVRAYVVESDVTSNQQRIAAIRQRARFS
jgi:hypothetical protein